MTTIAITGAAGRMGRRLVALAREAAVFQVVAAIERPDHPMLATDAGEAAGVGHIGVPITFDLRPTPQVLIDFTSPPSTRHWLKVCRDRGIAMVVGTTGLHRVDHAAIDVAAEMIPVLQAPNMSLGVNLLFKIAGEVAKRLGDDYDVEIIEAHHRHKVDAPSGTALKMGEVIAGALGRDLRVDAVYGREGVTGERKAATIGFSSIRGGDIVGDHTVMFAGVGERIEITHKSASRATYAEGSLRAVRFLAGKRKGLFDMFDVLGLR
jgi:4-hydroxy-tetrahydrodipicolinate reductase